MKAENYSMEVQARLILNRRELQLMNHLCSYSASWAESCQSSAYCGGVTVKEIEELLSNIRTETQKLMDSIEDAKTKLFKSP